jgi:Tol biopolymer transport system component
MAAISRPPPGKPARLVYVRSSHDTNIWRVETSRPGAPATSPPVPVISSTRVDTNPKLSPDGRRVVFASDRSGEMEIWLADPDGGNAVPLTSLGVTSSGSPRWSPDGQTIVFDSNLEGPVEIYVVPASGGRPRPLTFPPANARTPSFSSDGKWVYFNSTRSGENQVWKVPAEGGKPVQVTRQGGYLALESPDGTYLYYTLAPVAASTVWRMPAAGGEPVKVLEGVVQHAFAPLNEGIYYVVQPGRSPARLEYLDFATGRSTTVAALGPRPSFGFTVSADGRTILYPHVDSSVDDLMLVENFR